MERINGKSGVYIIGMTDCGEAVCAAAGRISTQQGTSLEIFDRSADKEKNASLICKVTKSGHTSTVEHVFFNLAFENVSVAVEQFMIEFRLASFTVKSRRYVDFSDCGYLVPEFNNDTVTSEYKAHMNMLFNEYNAFVESGVPKEDARFLLPYCFFSNFYCSLNGRELLLVLKRMLYGRESANPEIYTLGKQLLEQAQKLAPGMLDEFEARAPKMSDEADIELVFDADRTEKADSLAELVSFTPDAAKAVALSYLIGCGKYPTKEYELAADKNNRDRIISAVMNSTRQRSLEAATFTFKLNNVSLSCITHFARHRMQSIIIPALSCAKRDNYIIPETIAENKDLLNRYVAAFTKNTEFYNKLKAMGYAESILVFCLLSGNTLDIVTTMNARELLLFFKLRACNRAQWEIRAYAAEMLRLLRANSPELFRYYGPSCCVGTCPEGRLTCGKSAEMKALYAFENTD